MATTASSVTVIASTPTSAHAMIATACHVPVVSSAVPDDGAVDPCVPGGAAIAPTGIGNRDGDADGDTAAAECVGVRVGVGGCVERGWVVGACVGFFVAEDFADVFAGEAVDFCSADDESRPTQLMNRARIAAATTRVMKTGFVRLLPCRVATLPTVGR